MGSIFKLKNRSRAILSENDQRSVIPILARAIVVRLGGDIDKMLAELRTERNEIEESILLLERIAAGRGRRRGRPPAWMSVAKRRLRLVGGKNKPKAA